MMDILLLWYIVPLVALIMGYVAWHNRAERRAVAIKVSMAEAGLHEPVSLHPKIDPLKCIGCGSCVAACPEGDVLGLIKGKAELIAASECVGHGACRMACPSEAIELVFGTEKRGVDLPHVGPDFQTNVPGLYIAGELGGMGLIRNAIDQGRQAIISIAKAPKYSGHSLDVIIVGAGPAGISASLAAKSRNLRYLTVEQDTLGGTVAHFPRGKLVMTSPADLPLYGKVKFGEIGKDELLRFWSTVASHFKLNISFGERVLSVDRQEDGFRVQTTARVLTASSILLSVGRRGTPRQLGIPGEELSKVVYRLTDPEQFHDKRVAVVGGGDSALEAAATLAESNIATTLIYRGDAFARAKPKNRKRIEDCFQSGRLDVRLATNILNITSSSITVETDGARTILDNDALIVCAGGVLPTEFLSKSGIRIETKFGVA